MISIGHAPSVGRQRFSLGHEIAHLICDKNTGSFKCAKEDISPKNAEVRSVEAFANNFASQLILPDYLVNPWMHGKKVTLDVAAKLAEDFCSSRTAAAIKVVKRAPRAVCLVCHDQKGRVWFQKNSKFPHDFFIVDQLHQETSAFQMAFGQMTGLSRPKKEQANYWLSGRDTYPIEYQIICVASPRTHPRPSSTTPAHPQNPCPSGCSEQPWRATPSEAAAPDPASATQPTGSGDVAHVESVFQKRFGLWSFAPPTRPVGHKHAHAT